MTNSIIFQAIKKATNSNSRFFAFREPNSSKIVFGADNGIKSDIQFIVHPFNATNATPEVCINASQDAQNFVSSHTQNFTGSDTSFSEPSTSKEEYIQKVDKIVTAIKDNQFQKIVFSNVFIYENKGVDLATIFQRLESKYPTAFVFLYSTPETGVWIGATPEILLTKKDSELHTMALAGTRKAGSNTPWGNKEIEEQQFVTDYISGLLSTLKVEHSISDKYTKRAGNIEHICNDITMCENNESRISAILQSLHPTPAIAGIPTHGAIEYLAKIESHNRRYYGGYIGPKYANGDFSYYVNLRSMLVSDANFYIYVGGGITKDSVPEDEWNEILRKSHTLLDAINI